jgi:hypothetical protein
MTYSNNALNAHESFVLDAEWHLSDPNNASAKAGLFNSTLYIIFTNDFGIDAEISSPCINAEEAQQIAAHLNIPLT